MVEERIFFISGHGSIIGDYSFALPENATAYLPAKTGTELVNDDFDPLFFKMTPKKIIKYLADGRLPTINAETGVSDYKELDTVCYGGRFLEDMLIEFEPFFYNRVRGKQMARQDGFMKVGVYELPLSKSWSKKELEAGFFTVSNQKGVAIQEIEGTIEKIVNPEIRDLMVRASNKYNETRGNLNDSVIQEAVHWASGFNLLPIGPTLMKIRLSELIAQISAQYPMDNCHFIVFTCRVLMDGKGSKYLSLRETASKQCPISRRMSGSHEPQIIYEFIPKMLDYLILEYRNILDNREQLQKLVVLIPKQRTRKSNDERISLDKIQKRIGDNLEQVRTMRSEFGVAMLEKKISLDTLGKICDVLDTFIIAQRVISDNPNWQFPQTIFNQYFSQKCYSRVDKLEHGQTYF